MEFIFIIRIGLHVLRAMYCIIMNKLSYIKRYHINPSHFGFLKPRVGICLVKLFFE